MAQTLRRRMPNFPRCYFQRRQGWRIWRRHKRRRNIKQIVPTYLRSGKIRSKRIQEVMICFDQIGLLQSVFEEDWQNQETFDFNSRTGSAVTSKAHCTAGLQFGFDQKRIHLPIWLLLCSEAVNSMLVKLEKSPTVILPFPNNFLWWKYVYKVARRN